MTNTPTALTSAPSELHRTVESHLVVEVDEPSLLSLEIAAAGTEGSDRSETLTMTLDGESVEPVELLGTVGTRVHSLWAQPGRLLIDYRAEVTGRAEPVAAGPLERFEFLRPSRYAESDRIEAVARAEFAGITGATNLLSAVSSWVGSRLEYVPGSSGPTDGAVDTMLVRRGVCRDYAHLVTALLRARDVPARLVSVYAPGLDPMDFHAVVEAMVPAADGSDRWCVVDATLLAPRSSLLRIATGRDAADTAFMSNYGGAVRLLEMSVSAWTDGDLPSDDVNELVTLG